MDNILSRNIVKELGLDTLSEEKQSEILGKIGQIIFQAVLIRLLAILDEKDKDEFDELLAEKAGEEGVIMEFLQGRVANLDEIVKEEIIKFKTETLDIMSKID